jgi:protein-tyrosine phosphatase
LTQSPKRILFVCLGNIVRSPLAEGLFRSQAEKAGLNGKYEVDSAGTGGWHVGEPPDPRMQRVAARRGLVYTHRGRQFHPADFERFDLILAMDRDNEADLLAMARLPGHRQKVRLLRAYDPEGGPKAQVPDPYYGGIDGFEEVYSVVERSVKGLIEELESDKVGR